VQICDDLDMLLPVTIKHLFCPQYEYDYVIITHYHAIKEDSRLENKLLPAHLSTLQYYHKIVTVCFLQHWSKSPPGELIRRKWIIKSKSEWNMNKNNRILTSDLLLLKKKKKQEDATFWSCDFLPLNLLKVMHLIAQPLEPSTRLCLFHLQFSLSSLNDRRSKLLYFWAFE